MSTKYSKDIFRLRLLSTIFLVVVLVSIVKCSNENEIEMKEPDENSTPVTIVLTSKPATQAPLVSTTSVQPSTTARPSTTVAPVVSTTSRRFPCQCQEGTCLCCTGYLLNRFNVTTRNKACLSVQYEPDEFEFNFKLLFNNRQLYQNRISGKNPQPICLPIRRIVAINVCIRFSNVYLLGRNLHACLDFEGDWNDIELFQVSFECFRLGADGVAVVRPEDGGGLPIPTPTASTSQPQDYDDSAK
ncbi:uncharacterized protein [Halyomorpha halys]|uniref:uncharacterized protein n=1 Tax=Halyomorpha halys TaxID=286706 RepID=UPI0006D50078|nr:uncharacterized protein LOC106678752 [Halyomorpha halys]